MAVGQEQAHHLLYGRQTGRFSIPGARSRVRVSDPYRAAADRRQGRGCAAVGCGPLWPGILLLDLAQGVIAGESWLGQGPAPVAESLPDLGWLRTTSLLPQIRA